MTTQPKKIVPRLLGVFTVSITCALALHLYSTVQNQPLLTSLNYIYYDQKQKILLNDDSIDESIQVVEIDDSSLMQLGRWPWPRKLTAELIETILQRGAKKLVLDIVFAESSDHLNDQALIDVIKKYPDEIIMGGYVNNHSEVTTTEHAKCLEDFIFTKKNKVVTDYWRNGELLTPSFHVQLNSLYQSVLEQQLLLDSKKSIFDFTDLQLTYINAEYAKRVASFCASFDPAHFFFTSRPQKPSDILLNFELMQNENPNTGVFSVSPDNDGSIRRYYFSYRLFNYSIPTSSGLLATYTPEADFFWINYSQKRPLKISAIDFLKNSDILLTDQTVFLGVTSPGIYDIRKTPIAPAMPGTYILAQAASNILNSNFILFWKWPVPFTILIFSLIYLQVFFLKNMMSWRKSIFVFATILCTIFTTELVLLKYNYFFWSVELYLTWLIALIYNTYFYFKKERSQKNFIKDVFSKYMSENVIDDLLKNPEKINLVGEKRNLTIFFSDIRNFTSICEKLDPLNISRFLNIYFSPMVQIIKSNNGTVDKFIGDGLMSFFGAPLANVNNSEDACRAALQCQDVLTRVNQDLRNQISTEIQVGIGLNQQDVFVGNIGTEQLQSYTVIGDGVNLTARLQGLTKKYGELIIVSESVYFQNRNKFIFRKLDVVKVRGRIEPITIYSLLPTGTDPSKNEMFSIVLDHFFNKNLITVRIKLNEFLQKYPNDTPALIINSRLQSIEKNPVLNWDSELYGSS